MKNKAVFILLIGFLITPFGSPALSQQVTGDILCPNPDQAAKNAPKNLSDVQADIERFNLCVQRAKLLNELNELSKKNEDDVLSTTFIGTGPAANSSINSLPPLPGIEDDPIDFGDVSDIEIDTATIEPIEEEDVVSVQEAFTPPKSLQNKPKITWALRNIYGSAATLTAEIVSSEGQIANVQVGDQLSDGITVKRVSALGVVLNDKGKDIAVNWLE